MNTMKINFLGFMCGLYWTHDTYFRHYRRLALVALQESSEEQQEAIKQAWTTGWKFGYSKAGCRRLEELFPMPTLTVEEIDAAHALND